MTELDDGKAPQDKAKVFLSYSRKDRERAQSIADVLRERHFGVFKDTDDILPTEEWKGRLEQLISEADTIVFLLSPHSIASEVCAWEVEYAKSLKKRIAPIVITEVDTGEIPADLARLNFIFCTERDRFQDAIDNLISALNTDIDWVREHTRLAGLADRWEKANQPSHLLLRGQDIHDAEQWRDTRPDEAPHITLQQSRFIAKSRGSAVQRQRIVTISSIIGFVFALSLAVFAYLQREAAIENEQLAREQRNEAQTNQSLLLAGFAEESASSWGPVEGVLLSLEALPDQLSASPSRRDRPLVDEAQLMLRSSRRDLSEEAVLLSGLSDSTFSLSSDEHWVAVHSPQMNSVYLLDLTGEYELQHITETTISGAPSFSLDNMLLTIPDSDGHVKILATDSSLTPYTIQVSTSTLSVADFINNDQEILTIDNVSTVRIVDIETGSITFEKSADRVIVSPDGSRFALLNGGVITVYDSTDKSAISSSEEALSESVEQITQFTFSRDNRWLAGATEHLTVIFDVATMAVYGNTPVQDMSILSFGFGPENKWHYVSGANGKTDLYDIENGILATSHSSRGGWAFDVAIAADRTAALTSSTTGWIQLWSIATGETSAFLGGHTDVVTQVSFLENSRKAISLSADGTLRLWSLEKWINSAKSSGEETLIEGYAGTAIYNKDRSLMALSETGIFQLETGESVSIDELDPRYTRFVKFDESGSKLLTLIESEFALDPVDACLVDTGSKSIERCFANSNEGRVQSFDIDKRAQTVVISEFVENDSNEADRYFVTLDSVTGDEIGRLMTAPGDRLSSPVLSSDGEAVFSLSREQELRKYDRTLTEVLSSFGPAEGGAEILFFPDKDRVLFYWAVRDVAEIWDTTTGRQILTFDFTVAYSGAEIVFSPEGNFLVSVTDSETLTVYDTNSGEQHMQLTFASETVLEKPVFSPDEKLVTAHADQTIIVWDLVEKQMVSEFEVDFRGFAPLTFGKAFVDDGNEIVAWSWDGPVKFPLIIDPQTVISMAQQQIPRCLSTLQRKRYFLSPEPPRWCITGPGLENETDSGKWKPKFPYTDPKWREWLIANDNGETHPLPE